MKDIFESLEKVNEPSLQLVVPSYYLLSATLKSLDNMSRSAKTFCDNLHKYLDEKYWTSIKAFHWMATFLDPTFKNMAFIPHSNRNDITFRRNLLVDIDKWLMQEMASVAELMENTTSDRYIVFTNITIFSKS